MAASNFASFMECDIGTEMSVKRKRTNSCETESVPNGFLFAHFKPNSQFRSRADRYKFIKDVLRTEPYKHINDALELRNGRQNIYVKCKNLDILNRITTSGALGEILVRPKVYGRGQCMNLIVFDVPFTVEMQELTEYNAKILHARRMQQYGSPTERVIITYEGASAPKTIKVVEGLMPLRCAIYHSLTPFCSHCAKWGHSYRGCPRDAPRCMYCARAHLSKECAEKIAQKESVPRKCVNCRYEHNANSPLCVYYPKDRKKKNAARNPPSGSLNPASAPGVDNITEFPSLPERKAIISHRVPKQRNNVTKNKQDTSTTERHAPLGTGAAWSGTPVPVDDGTAVASMAQIVLRPGYAPGGTCNPWNGTPKARNKPKVRKTALKSQQDTSSSVEQVPPGTSLPVVPHENISLPPETKSKPVPPGPHLPLCTPRDSPPAASTSVQDTEANTVKEMLQSMTEMLQAQTTMMHTLIALIQQQMSQQQERHEQLLASFVGAQQHQANGENI